MPVRVLLLLLLAVPVAAHAQTVVCFGDSLTAGRGAPPGASYPDDLRRDLQHSGAHATIINQGISGDTTKDGLARIGAVLRAHPAIVVLELGANDGLRGFPVPGIEQNLERTIQQLQRAHIRILLLGMQLPPNLGPDYVQPFNAMYPALAAKYKLPLVPFLLQGVYGVEGLMSEDYLHPNGAGYRIVARNVLSYLQPMLGGGMNPSAKPTD